jgi:hypothetical protein
MLVMGRRNPLAGRSRTWVARQDNPAADEAGTRARLMQNSPDDLYARPLARLELWILQP